MAAFPFLQILMSANVDSALKRRLAEYVVPQTERLLGSGGTRYTVTESSGRQHVALQVGFPCDRTGTALLAGLRDFVSLGGFGDSIGYSIEWQVSAHAVQPGLKALPLVRNVVAIASAKGGVGKSTVTSNVALALKAEGARVGILDADIYGPSQPRILNLIGSRPDSADGKIMQPLTAFGMPVMSIGFLVDERQAVAWRGPMVTSALNQMLTQTDWGELDYLLIDMPPGTGDIQLTLAQKVPVSGAVIVTTPQEIALADARKGLEMFRKLRLPVLGVVENMAVHVCSACGHEEHLFGANGGARLATEYELPLLGSLALARSVGEQTDAGAPTVISEPDGAAAQGFRRTALRIAGELAATGRDYSHLFPKVSVEGKQ
jgi:ATP-binding protein involved in chromosome partitioning